MKKWVLLLALAGCVDASTEEAEDTSPLTVDPNVLQIDLKSHRSVLITAPEAIDPLGRSFPLGTLLKRVGKAAISEWAPAQGQQAGFPLSRVHDWVRNPFKAAENEFAEHDDLGPARRLGIRHGGNPYRRVQDLWPGLGNKDVGDGPFRLLAVVNRMDLAGDVDERGIIDAAKQPRSFGEARLIFGLVDKDHEANTGRPYPMTFIIEYRLPALDAGYNAIESYDHTNRLFDAAEWRTQMERWGKVWRQLSATEPTTRAYRDHLSRIVTRFARPENFVALRANLEIRTNGEVEFELREWYMLKQDQWLLIPRKPRDEPYDCGNNPDLAKLVEHYWDATRGDLNMARVTPAKPLEVIGYNVPRTVRESPVPTGKTLGGCPVDAQGKPLLFEMDAPAGEENRITAPFGRARANFVWGIPNLFEQRRHQFAIRTCTGCHSKEAGVFGFHVFPRMPGKQAQLSPFLTGEATFNHGGKTYAYHELDKRRTWVRRASERDVTLFEGMYRDDAQP